MHIPYVFIPLKESSDFPNNNDVIRIVIGQIIPRVLKVHLPASK